MATRKKPQRPERRGEWYGDLLGVGWLFPAGLAQYQMASSDLLGWLRRFAGWDVAGLSIRRTLTSNHETSNKTR